MMSRGIKSLAIASLSSLLVTGALCSCSSDDKSPADQGSWQLPQDTGIVFTDQGGEAGCGNGSLDPGEDCESPLGACCDSNSCFFKSSEIPCRPAAGECDVAGLL